MIQNRGLCYACTSSFEIIPPLDLEYCVPREQPKTTDYLSRIYECEESHHRSSLIHSNGISISNWQGIFTASTGEQIRFKGRDMSKNDKFVVLRTYFTDSVELSWMNGLVCLVYGHFDSQDKSFKCEGYELM